MIRCVTGDVAPDAVALVLPHEHVLRRVGDSTGDAGVRVEDLREFRVAPGGQNLVLEKEDEARQELEALSAHSGATARPLVVDVTVPIEGRDEFAAKRMRLAHQFGVLVVSVATCDPQRTFPLGLRASERSEGLAKALETELVFGFGAADSGGGARGAPGAVYQQIHAASSDLSVDDGIVAHALALAQQRTGAPLYLSFSFSSDIHDDDGSGGQQQREIQHQQLIRNWLQVLLGHGANSSKIVVCHADQWGEEDVSAGEHSSFLQSLLRLGVRLLFTMIGLLSVSDAVVINPCLAGVPDRDAVLSSATREPPRDSSIARCIARLIRDQDTNLRQLLLSTNIQQRVQYRRYGGGGYAYLFTHFQQRLQHLGVSEQQFQQLVRANPLELLSWYTAPAPAAAPKEFLRCSICRRDFEPVVGEYFTKFEFIYCGTKCLRKHSRQGFAKLPLAA